MDLDEEQLAPRNGSTRVELPEGVSEVTLPLHAPELLSDGVLKIAASDGVTVGLSADLLREVLTQWGDAADKNGRIVLTVEPVEPAAAQRRFDESAHSEGADLLPAGPLVNISLALELPAGGRIEASRFDKPLRLEFPIPAGNRSRTLGIYYVAADGSLEYVGGTREGGVIYAELSYLSEYALIDYRKPYSDLAPEHWAYEAVQVLSARQIVNGAAPSRFEPEAGLTRAQFAAMLVRALGIRPSPDGATSAYADVDAGAWYADAVAAATQAGIVDGVADGRFAPDAAVTREQMAAMLIRAAGVAGLLAPEAEAVPFDYADADDISGWAAEAVRLASTMGWMEGKEGGRFDPLSGATRAESAQLLFNALAD